jgi:Subtilase family/Divergent InlB B-repeat domain/PASTA domain
VVEDGVAKAVEKQGSAKVVIVFRAAVPPHAPLASAVSSVKTARNQVLMHAGTGFRPTTRWDAVNAVSGWITADGLDRLAADPAVLRIGLDGGAGHSADDQSTPLIHADQAHAMGYTGSGVTVGVLDTGIDENHPDLHDAIAGEHCFVDCPGGEGSAQDQNGHGTNVAGIIASRGTVAPVGIAPAAKLVMVKMLDRDGQFQSADSIVSSLNWLALNRPDVKVVNMSIVTRALFSGDCDDAAAWTMAISSAVATLHSAGVTVFASSGNDGSFAQMAAPACMRGVVAVGAVSDSAYGSNQGFCRDPSAADRVTCFSDSGSGLDLLAPGALITSTGLRSRGSPISTYVGTSQASPHAAGTAALLLQSKPSLTPDQVELTLKGSGKPITDWRNHRVTPRVDALAALTAQMVDHTLTVSKSGTGIGSVKSVTIGIDCGSSCSHTYAFASAVTLTAVPKPGFALTRWTGDCSGTRACVLWMGADRSVTAVFGRPKCVVPRVTGRTLAAAKAAIRKRHCRVGKIAHAYSRLKKGLVMSQRPPAGRNLRAGAPVAVTISRGLKSR